MAYLSLYRKYRSQSFEEVSGQDHVTRTLQNAVRSGRIAHAYLFCGPRGTGKTSTARLLAKALNCERGPNNGPNAEPCNECDACVQVNQGRFLDLKEIDAASNRSIEDVRTLREQVVNAAAGGRFKVYIIDEVHQLTPDAFNALLKTLEEPPPHVIFVLATTDFHKVPATIVSRCQRFEFRRASMEHLRERIAYVAKEEGFEIEEAALDLIARDANGGWRDALSLLEQVIAFSEGRVTAKDVYTVLGTVEADTLLALAERVRSADGAEVYRLLEALIAEGKDPRQLLRDLTAHYRCLMLAGAGSMAGVPADQAAAVREQARSYGHGRLIHAIQVLAEAEREARWSEQPRLLLELAVARLMQPQQAAGWAQAPGAEPAPSPRAEAPAPRPQPRPPAPSPRAPAPPASPFADEPAPAAKPTGNGRSGGFGAGEMPPPPLTVGDARTGGSDEDEDFSALFDGPLAAPAPAVPKRQTPSPAPPAAGPAAAPEPAASGAPLDIDLVRRKWRLVGEELKRDRKMTVHACLADSVPDHFDRDELVVRFPNTTMAEMFGNRGKAFSEPLLAALQRVTGISCRVRAEAGPGTGLEGGSPAPPSARPRPAGPAGGGPAGGTAPAAPHAAASKASAPDADRPPGKTAAPSAAPRPGSGELVHDVLEVFEGKIIHEDDAKSE